MIFSRCVFKWHYVLGLVYADHDCSFYRQVGLGFKTPKEALEGKYIDKKCPFTGNVSIRGRILRGMVVSTKMNR